MKYVNTGMMLTLVGFPRGFFTEILVKTQKFANYKGLDEFQFHMMHASALDFVYYLS